MIDVQKLKEIMQFIITEYKNGCAIYNWENKGYMGIVNNERDIEDYEVDSILNDCLKEFMYEDLKLCGCGVVEYTCEVLRLILKAQNEESIEKREASFNNMCGLSTNDNINYYGLVQFVLYILDSHGFLKHNNSIDGAVLTPKGKIFLDLLEMEKIKQGVGD